MTTNSRECGSPQNTSGAESLEIDIIKSFVRGKRFVVIEDDVLISEALSKSLELMEGEVKCFDNAEYALQCAAIGNADCYIVDYRLPGPIDGINFLLRLHQKLHKPICAVMMSGDTSPYLIRKSELFDWPLLHKPVNISKVISRLSEQSNRIA